MIEMISPIVDLSSLPHGLGLGLTLVSSEPGT